MDRRIDINLQTKIGEMLDAYPHLEDTLLNLSPSFAKLKNPLLRKTVGRIASLRQAAQTGGVDVGRMISILRKEAGLDDKVFDNEAAVGNTIRPRWATEDCVSISFDASPVINGGGNPMKDILANAERLAMSETMLLISPFKPAPIIELLEKKGYQVWTECADDEAWTYIQKVE